TSRPILDRLRERTSETAQLWVRRGDSRICLESSDAPHELRVILAPGSALPLAEGGSASLALLGEERQPASAGPGWVESMSHRTVGLGSVSAPVIIDGEIVAAICVAAPLPRIPVSPGHAWGSMVSEAAESLSRLRSR